MSDILAIDTHAHVYPAFYLDMLEKKGVDPSSTQIARGINADSTEEDISQRITWMDRAGVQQQILAVTPQVPPDAEAAAWINDEYERLIKAHPGRFQAYGALPLPHVDDALKELKAIYQRGFLGVSLPTVFADGTTLDDHRFEPLWQSLNDHNAVVNIHPTGNGACSPLIANKGLSWVNGAPVEDATAVLHLLKAGIPVQFPNIQFHIGHLGGDLAFLFQRIEDNYEDWNAFPQSPQESLRLFYFDAANFYEPALRLAVESYGATQILAGSDHPYFQNEKYVRAFSYIRGAALPTEVKNSILVTNAERLYSL